MNILRKDEFKYIYVNSNFPDTIRFWIEDYEKDQKWLMYVWVNEKTGKCGTTYGVWTLEADNVWDLFYKINERLKEYTPEYRLY